MVDQLTRTLGVTAWKEGKREGLNKLVAELRGGPTGGNVGQNQID